METLRLTDTIQALKDRFYTVEEFPFLNMESFPQDPLEVLKNLSPEEIKPFAFRLKGREIEGLLLNLVDMGEGNTLDRVMEVLKYRGSLRVQRLLSSLYQFNYHSAGLAKGLLLLSGLDKRLAFVEQLGATEDKFQEAVRLIGENDAQIEGTYRKLDINPQSPFAQETSYLFLLNAGPDQIKQNLKWMVKLIERLDEERLLPMLINYLNAFDVTEFHDGINLAILEKMGQPNISVSWAPFDKELKDKFTHWHFLNRLRIHTMYIPRKYEVLSQYYKQVRTSREIAKDEIMIMDMGEIVVADIAERPYSFFYEKAIFDKEMTKWEETGEEPTFIRIDRKSITARDFIIEEVEEPCVKLSYEGVDILYISEMLDIKTGLEPDLRRKQLAKLKKRRTLKK